MTSPQRKLSSRTVVLLFLLLMLIAAAFWWARIRGIRFNLSSFLQQVGDVSWWRIVVGILLIYGSYFLRSYRWSIFLRPQRRVAPLFTLGPQFTGFTAVAIFGRIADLSRPYLIARKARLSLASQIAVYTIERMFDLGAAALIFSSALAFTPADMPHHEVFVRVGLASLAGTLFLAFFAVAVRVAGIRIASSLGALTARFSMRFGTLVQEKILAFRDGLQSITSASDAVWVGLLSIVQWMLIALSYVATAHAFAAEPTLAHLSFPSTMLLMGASIGSSVLQLPVLGWFTQIGATAASMHAFYNTPLETATACGTVLLCVNILCIVPAGLLFAQIDGIRMNDLRKENEAVEETLA